MSADHHIFHDPSGRRHKIVKFILFIILIAFIASAWYAHHLFHRIPELPIIGQLQETDYQLETEKIKKISSVLLKKERTELANDINKTELLAKTFKNNSGNHQVWSIYEPGNESAFFSFRKNFEAVNHLILPVFNLGPDASTFESPPINAIAKGQEKETLDLAKSKGLKIYGRLTNDSIEGYLSTPVIQLIAAPEKQIQIIEQLISTIKKQKLAGLIVDFRELDKEHYFQLQPFFTELRKAWTAAELTGHLGISYQATVDQLPLWKFGQTFDVVLMQAFGERSPQATSGPVASASWFNDSLQFALNNIPANKLVVMFDNSAFDWNSTTPKARARTYLSVISQAKEISESNKPYSNHSISLDPKSFNINYGYLDEQGGEHQVWFSDAINSFNQYSIAHRAGIKQVGIWSLGTEDPGVWSFVTKNPEYSETRSGLKSIVFPYDIQFEGRGDLLSPQAEPQTGERSIEYDSETQMIVGSSYLKYPSAVVVEHRGYRPKTLALTFDDAPSDFTNELLDVLAKENVKATFFVIGEQVQEHPEVLRRIYKEGHDLGNHTFTHPELALVSEQREILELNSTQRLVQSVLGKSLVLFRPPYISEGSPFSLDEVRVIKTASKLNYITVGVSADIQDWDLYKTDLDGNEVLRTGQNLADDLLAKLNSIQGNVILLHDGLDDREATIEAVRILIPELRARGYDLVSISELLGVERSVLLPTVSKSELILGGLSRAYIEVLYFVRTSLEVIFILVAVFGVLRLASFIILSKLSLRREKPYIADNETFKEPVSIIIAAYNEEKVIVRTIKSLLASNYPEFEIIVVDDGSKDRTSELVNQEFFNEPKVKLITKENGGKSSALNVGLNLAKYEIMIGLDADTQYSADAIGAMARHFADPEVGAVAGNVKVGNRDSWLLQCQSIEYITNQNFGRRAFSYADAITIVPGAAGAWRKSAVMEVGMYLSDTLGEDMELTWRIRKAGYRIVFEPLAYGYTEAPHTLGGVFKQRFRWIYGQLQILVKHRDVFFNSDHKWFGWFGAPLILVDDIFLFLSPLADLQALIALSTFIFFLTNSSEMSMEALTAAGPWALFLKTMVVYLIFFASEVLCTIYAFRIDKEPLRPIWLLFLKQFFYRQLMYIVAYKAIWRAMTGWRQRWGVLQRTGTVGSDSTTNS